MPNNYTFDERTKRYRDTRTGRFLSEVTVNKVLKIALSAKSATELTRMYKDGTISKDIWHRGFRKLIKETYINSAVLAKGGREQMTDQDWGKTGGHVAEQYWHLDRKEGNFLDSIDDLTLKQAQARAEMYIRSGKQVFEEINRDNKKELGAIFEWWHLGGEENCESCLELTSKGMVPIGTLGTVPGAGETICLTNCQCRITYHDSKGKKLSAKSVLQYLLIEDIPFEIVFIARDPIFVLGSAKSGFKGHRGRPGKRGGSVSKGISGAIQNAKNLFTSVYDGPAADLPLTFEDDFQAAARFKGDHIAINPDYFNESLIDKGGKEDKLRRTQRRLDTLRQELDTYKDDMSPKQLSKLQEQISHLEGRAGELQGSSDWMAPDNLKEVLLHEYAHAMASDLQAGSFPDIPDFLPPSQLPSGTKWEDTLAFKLEGYSRQKGRNISEYATTNGEEYFAEAFVRYTQGRKDVVMPELSQLFDRITHADI